MKFFAAAIMALVSATAVEKAVPEFDATTHQKSWKITYQVLNQTATDAGTADAVTKVKPDVYNTKEVVCDAKPVESPAAGETQTGWTFTPHGGVATTKLTAKPTNTTAPKSFIHLKRESEWTFTYNKGEGDAAVATAGKTRTKPVFNKKDDSAVPPVKASWSVIIYPATTATTIKGSDMTVDPVEGSYIPADPEVKEKGSPVVIIVIVVVVVLVLVIGGVMFMRNRKAKEAAATGAKVEGGRALFKAIIKNNKAQCESLV